jgi:aspartokinase-like uncharacterized kinase
VTVVKLGGSLLDDGHPRALLDALVLLARARPIVVVPGGGPFADAVRHAADRHDPGASAAHWMAILAMDQHAQLLAGLAPEARLVAEAAALAAVTTPRRLAILAPYAWLRAEDPLPHSWDVTSDSIAAWIAGRLGARRLVLVKAGAAPEARPRAQIVDAYFGRALPAGLDCRIVSGRHPEQLEAAIAG